MLPRRRSFVQVDVFGTEAYRGNPLAVVIDGDDLDYATMAAFANWTNLSETTFLLPPTSPAADYRLRIFTPGGEIPFAGHPTLGSAHAWMISGGVSRKPGAIVQECGIGLVDLRQEVGLISFKAPPLIRTGALDDDHLERIARGLGIARDRIVSHQWVDNGPGWAAVRLRSAAEVLALRPDDSLMRDLMLGVVGAYPEGSPEQFELRAFAAPFGVREDPVTGSLNAGVAQWLIDDGAAPSAYKARQGTSIGRSGVVTLAMRDGDVWVGGPVRTCITGTVKV
jgi:PhzF family phenazine biosynthesis protein